MFLYALNVIGCVNVPSPYDVDDIAVTEDGADSGSGLVDIEPADLVAHRVYRLYPDAEETGARVVENPDGSRLGLLVTWQIGEDEPDEGAGVFRGSGSFSVLVSDDPELPLWLMSTAGAPVGLPPGALVYVPRDQRWFTRDALGALRALDGDDFTEVPARALPGSASAAEENLRAREAAEDDLLQAVASCSGNYGTALGSLWGITAYSNGSCSGTGSGSHQCVSFIDRLHPTTASHSGNANTYDDSNNARRMNMFQYTNGSLTPQVGDVCVSNGGTYGHVCALYALTSTTGTVIHQNWSSSSATLRISRSGDTLGNLSSSYTIANLLRPGWNFGNAIDTTSSIYGWSVRNASVTSVDSTGFTINPGSDPGFTSPSGLQLDPTHYTKLKIRMSSRAPDGNVRVYFTTSTYSSWSELQAESTTITTDGAWRDVTVNLGVNGYWVYGGRVNQIRIDPANNGNSGSADTIRIDKAWFTY